MDDHDCNKGAEIEAIKRQQIEQTIKLDLVLNNQVELATDLKGALRELTDIIKADIRTRAEVEQLKKDRELLYIKTRQITETIQGIKERNAKCDGAGIFENFPKVWNWYQQERGIRRFVPAAMAAICGFTTIYFAWIK